MKNVCESAAIYRIKKSYERKGEARVIQPENLHAASENWQEPDESFLNEVYDVLKEIHKQKAKAKHMEKKISRNTTVVRIVADVFFKPVKGELT